MDPMIISIAAFVSVAGVIGAIVMLVGQKDNGSVENRLAILAGKKAPDQQLSVSREMLMREGMSGLAGWMSDLMERFGNIRLLFVQADLPMKPETFAALVAGCTLAGAAIAIVTNLPVPLIPVVALAVGILPLAWLMWRRKRRFAKFAAQMPGAMELIARALRSGHSLASGMHVVCTEMNDPISKEFNVAYEEQNLGIPIDQSLKNMYKRMPNLDFKFFATAVVIQRQCGGDLAEILDKISHIIRERFRILGQVQALTGEGRISGVVLMLLPVALFFAVLYLNPEYVMTLFTDELGRKMIGVAIFLQVLGAICIKKIIQIKV
ncbi:Bacterial type II secretion system protein F domain protein [Caulifigura coniformis]|uniref:Bacterial type II secretion system protein F domain protein n=1 Tax=Caulifigura coniformis TaxID=2527983 RepID=A0A517S8C8_9PLAN|nr:type II secretion system F family protein [Caulifigura coniformis]QDT52379.1 Bacterial type II secretion system protein F domain protein [Caulifigura coniformis]